jgi:3-deoxy-D-manno-octulosonic-acid transferase
MIFAAKAAGVPLYMCNAQYPTKSMARDAKSGLRHDLMRGFAGAFVKSDLQAQRFASVGVQSIIVTGELRFDQPIPESQLLAAQSLRPQLAGARRVIAFASVTEPEEALFVAAAKAIAASAGNPQVIFIPRAPERFDAVAVTLAGHGLAVLRRSRALDDRLQPANLQPAEVLLGDSLGEMYFYLALADRVVVGGGFQPKGSHNIIEPLALGKPVIVGPHLDTIEYPAVEAIAAGVCRKTDADHLVAEVLGWPDPSAEAMANFVAAHSGATARTVAAVAAIIRP